MQVAIIPHEQVIALVESSLSLSQFPVTATLPLQLQYPMQQSLNSTHANDSALAVTAALLYRI